MMEQQTAIQQQQQQQQSFQQQSFHQGNRIISSSFFDYYKIDFKKFMLSEIFWRNASNFANLAAKCYLCTMNLFHS